MSLFQTSVIAKYLKSLDKEAVQIAYVNYKSHFHNTTIRENIRNSKEEQYQEGFLNDLFVNVLGYTKNPAENYNLTTEYKNVKDSKKADGAIVIPTSEHAHLTKSAPLVIGVIELKGTNVTDLGHVEVQAFSYKNNQPECVYLITSNFEKLRFYIDNAIENLEFNLFTLSEKDFELLYLCLAYSQIEKGIPKKIKDESLSHEDDITKQLYRDYSLFKQELHADLVAKNPEYDTLVLFHKSQKLLSRFLFLFFAEDRELLPPNSVRMILNDWRDLQERDVEIPLYDRFKKYFGYLNTGFKGKRYDVFAYNGGLFKPDTVLDTVKIDDELLYRHTAKISDYDFASEVDVNILGHIFENSLNELDELKAEIAGETIDKSKTKRKKDGVFYTPKYITKYIVDNTVGRLCTEKKAELGIEPDITTTMGHAPLPLPHAPLQKKTKQALYNKLTAYREWLLQITICDPACGSGAFLNQALNFLIDEHRYINELQAKLFGDSLVISDIENTILENNLFGVDINEESVEIARLSLWLRTAQPNRKLNDLSNNIKCGNSLIDDPAIAGEKAFDWEKEFPQVFELKQKKAWHITTATHNSRYSQRMFDNYVKLGEPVWLSEIEELIVSKTIAEIAVTDKLNVLAYNICGDHMHLLIVCEKDEVEKIVGKLKSMSARACNIAMGRTIPSTRGHAPSDISGTPSPETSGHAHLLKTPPVLPTHGETQTQLWTQKFGKKEITSEEQLYNTLNYIENNRLKHELTDINKDLQPLINQMVCNIQHAFRPENKGGFDVVIGNPPYVNANDLKKNLPTTEFDFLKDKYITAKGTVDLYIYFFERGLSIIKKHGYLSFITPNRFLSASYGFALREYLISNYKIEALIDYSDKNVFPDASTYPVITIIRKQIGENYEILTGKFDDETKELITKNIPSSKLKILDEYILGFLLNDKLEISEKIISLSESLSKVGKINATSTAKEADDYSTLINQIGGYKLINTGTIDPYICKWGADSLTDKGKKFLKPYLPKDNIIISKNRNFLYSSPKIIISKIGLQCEAFYDKQGEFASINTNCIHSFNNEYLPEYVLCWLNSKLYNYLFECFFDGLRMSGGYLLYSAPNIKNTYIQKISLADQQPFITKTDQMLSLNKELQEVSGKFQRNLIREFSLETLSSKFQNWYTLSYAEFIKELEKQKIKLSLHQKAEWETYFQQEAINALTIKTEIDSTDWEIDQMVYQLYGLTEEEIQIVEGK